MDPIELIFQTATELTGGIISDATTAIIGMISIGFIVFGFSILKDILLGNSVSNPMESDEEMKRASHDVDVYSSMMKKHRKASEAYQYYSRKRKKALRKVMGD